MKIIAISDLHGYLPELESFDLLLIAGDIVPTDCINIRSQQEWLFNEFVPWINKLSYENVWSKVVFTPGNHDVVFQTNPSMKLFLRGKTSRLIVLIHELYEFLYLEGETEKSLKIFGTPYCHQFGNWAFMPSDEVLTSHFKSIPNNIDILLTHDAPYGCSDQCYEGRSIGKHVGSKPLREAILEKQPKFCIHGHLHTSNHNIMQLNKTRVINVSLLNESYNVVYKPLVFDSYACEIEVEEKYDEEYIFPNRYGELIKLVKEGVDWILEGNLSYAGFGYVDDKTNLTYIDPSGGPYLGIGTKWFDFTIKSIKDVNGKIILEIER